MPTTIDGQCDVIKAKVGNAWHQSVVIFPNARDQLARRFNGEDLQQVTAGEDRPDPLVVVAHDVRHNAFFARKNDDGVGRINRVSIRNHDHVP